MYVHGCFVRGPQQPGPNSRDGRWGSSSGSCWFLATSLHFRLRVSYESSRRCESNVVNLGMWEQPANRAVASFDVRVVETFDSFARRERRGLVALAYGLMGDLQAAEEVTQDALFAASRRWNAVGQYDSPVGWVRRVVANRSTSMVRRRFADAQRFARLISRHSESLVVPLMPSESEHIWALVRQLPRRQAQVITLRVRA